jgi:asparagine synthase (glutamine-hydrolysing)
MARKLHRKMEGILMCGICGYYGVIDQRMIERMTETLILRGPDDCGTIMFPDDKVAFGHRRLSILDLTEAGHQPMANDNKIVWITYNGEIYNFIELRKELEKYGVRFKSRSDTEVILACYEKYGIRMVARLDGIFAFAIYDSKIRKMYLVRDHVGVKPLYYGFANGNFFFGSEIKAILASNAIVPQLNHQALMDYLTYLYVPCPLTMYTDIYQVPPAHFMTLDLNTGNHYLERYWNPLCRISDELSDPEEIKEIVRTTLSQTVKKQLISDVPVGAFLSGGIDSNIIVGHMAEHSHQRVRTFTAIFTDRKASYFNEKEEAARIARKFNTIHEELEIKTPTVEDISNMLSWTDQPFGNPTLFLSYLISKEMRPHIAVALSGAGGDELFGGYVRYKHFAFARSLVRICPFDLSRFAKRMLILWPTTLRPVLRTRTYKFFHGLVSDMSQHYLRWTYFLEDNEKADLTSKPSGYLSSNRVLEKLFNQSCHLKDLINMLQYVDLNSYLVDDILEYTDKSSMAASLEVRVPFLSPKMVELSFRIPGRHKICRGITKLPLRNAYRDFFPKRNQRSPKKGFSAPVKIWASDMDKYFERVEMNLPSECPLNFQGIKKLRHEHLNGRFDHGQTLFGILMLEMWLVNAIYK